MRKGWILVIAILLAIVIMGGLFSAAFFGRVPLGEPRLRVEFDPLPPWQMTPGDSLEVSIGIANDAWLFAWARNVRVDVSMPEGFTNTRTGTNECEINYGNLHGSGGLGNGLTLTASSNILLGNYTITIKVLGENVPEKIFTPQVIVLAP